MWGVSAPVWAALNVLGNKLFYLKYYGYFAACIYLFSPWQVCFKDTTLKTGILFGISASFTAFPTGSLYFLNTAHPAATSRHFPHFNFHVIIPRPSQALHGEARVHVTLWWAEQRFSSNNSLFVALNRQLWWFDLFLVPCALSLKNEADGPAQRVQIDGGDAPCSPSDLDAREKKSP